MSEKKPRILVTGASGLVGQRLSRLLREKGYEVLHLGRTPKPDTEFTTYRWDLGRMEMDPAAVENLYGIVHLAGAGIADGRWSAARKKEILSSRVDGLLLLRKTLQRTAVKPQVLVSASAVGLYGNRGDEILDETSEPQPGDFLSDTCVQWEAAVDELSDVCARTVKLRIGIVLSTKGGALAKMLPSYSFGTGAYFGCGRQWYSWIHIEDLCRMFLHALENPALSGPYNAVAPKPLTNRDFAREVGLGLGKKALLVSVPAVALRLAMGQMADVVLHSTRAEAQKILGTGFGFEFSEVAAAVRDLKGRGI